MTDRDIYFIIYNVVFFHVVLTCYTGVNLKSYGQ